MIKKVLKSCLVLSLVVGATGCANEPTNSVKRAVVESKETSLENLEYVNPFIGTGGHGHTFPGAVVPFGMVQLSPDNPSKGWDWTSGYHYSDNQLLGFSHTHLSGTGVGDMLDVLVMPFRGDYQKRRENDLKRVVSTYSHDQESASPGYYSVVLPEENVSVELTATERTGVHKYQFSGNQSAKVLIDLGYAQNYDKAVATFMRVVDNQTLVGYRVSTGWSDYQPTYFVAKFNRPFTHQFYLEGEPFFGSAPIKGDTINRPKTEVVLDFGDLSNKPLITKVGLSYTSIKGAHKNLAAEVKGFDFESIKQAAKNLWATQLNKFQVTDPNLETKTKFYTALYHSFLAPQTFNDVDGQYFGADGATHNSQDFKRYTLFSLWDTFRALHPLLTISDGQRVDDMVDSLLAFYDETGLLPTWDLMSNDTDVMIGYHAVPVIVDAYLKGLTDADPEKIFAAVKASAMQDQFGVDYFKEYGYIPSELEVEAVSKTLEYAFDDAAIAALAKKLGKDKEFEYFSQRAQAYKKLFDKSHGLMRGKDKDGNWVKDFRPTFVDHRNTDYTEANAWQYTWFAPHDVQGLIELFGGEKPFVEKLDTLFSMSSEMEGSVVSPDISGLIGQYAHGNEPVHHVPYMYTYANQKYKGEKRIIEIRDTMYRNHVDGLAGNDDLGQMSAWYVFSAIGFYPMNPFSGEYVFGTPEFQQVDIQLENGKVFSVKQQGKRTADNPYVKQIRLNGKVTSLHSLSHKDLLAGGELVFEF